MKLPKHILVVRLSAMGDVAMLVPVLRIFANTYPEVTLTVVSRAFFKPLFSDIPNCNFLVADVYGSHKGFGIFKLANEAKALGIDALADVHNVLRSKLLRTYLSLKGIKTAVIDKGRGEKKAATQLAATKKLRPLQTTHQRYAAVFRSLGYPIDITKKLSYSPKRLAENVQDIVGKHSKKLVGVAPFAAYKSKMYPLTMMREVLVKLEATQKYQLLLFGSKEESLALKELTDGLSFTTIVAGKLSFEEELALISNLDGMLSMDSGNGHLAAAYGIPVITLWGVTHPYLGFTPFGQPSTHQIIANRQQYPMIPTSVYGNKHPKGYEKVMQSIPIDLVVEKVQEVF